MQVRGIRPKVGDEQAVVVPAPFAVVARNVSLEHGADLSDNEPTVAPVRSRLIGCRARDDVDHAVLPDDE